MRRQAKWVSDLTGHTDELALLPTTTPPRVLIWKRGLKTVQILRLVWMRLGHVSSVQPGLQWVEWWPYRRSVHPECMNWHYTWPLNNVGVKIADLCSVKNLCITFDSKKLKMSLQDPPLVERSMDSLVFYINGIINTCSQPSAFVDSQPHIKNSTGIYWKKICV